LAFFSLPSKWQLNLLYFSHRAFFVKTEEDLKLQDLLDTLVATVMKETGELQRAALESMRKEIRSSTTSMTSLPKPLKFLRPHYDNLKKYHGGMKSDDNKVLSLFSPFLPVPRLSFRLLLSFSFSLF
jgi:hypothetical protein